MPQTRALVRPIVTKKDHQRHHHHQQQQQQQQQQHNNNATAVPLRPLSDMMHKGIQGEKEVHIRTHARIPLQLVIARASDYRSRRPSRR
jgi:hypothetical protein